MNINSQAGDAPVVRTFELMSSHKSFLFSSKSCPCILSCFQSSDFLLYLVPPENKIKQRDLADIKPEQKFCQALNLLRCNSAQSKGIFEKA